MGSGTGVTEPCGVDACLGVELAEGPSLGGGECAVGVDGKPTALASWSGICNGAGLPKVAEGFGDELIAARKLAGRGTGDCLGGICVAGLANFKERLTAAGSPTL